ncbi:MAG: hypothetical protein QOI46_5938 [Alphaproteobacteria bacterium]|jgi:hypothetical protein|nr:hypothetical protein [Alphaproteobacteria bacterium]
MTYMGAKWNERSWPNADWQLSASAKRERTFSLAGVMSRVDPLRTLRGSAFRQAGLNAGLMTSSTFEPSLEIETQENQRRDDQSAHQRSGGSPITLAECLSRASPAQSRRERLDYIVIFDDRHLTRVLRDCREYYNSSRAHLALSKHAPLRRPVQAAGTITRCSTRWPTSPIRCQSNFRKGQVSLRRGFTQY